MAEFPGFGVQQCVGSIKLSDPCLNPDGIQVGTPTNADSDYSHPATFSFPPPQVTPSICIDHAVYSCHYHIGPYTGGLNLCGGTYTNGVYVTVITFNVVTGSLIFDTNDFETFPPGSYEFVITITIGSVSVNTNIVIVLNPNCGSNTLTVVNQPAQTYYYHLSESQVCFFVYDINSLVTYTSTTSCGVPVIEFLDTDTSSGLTSIFSEDRSVNGAFRLCIGYTIDINFVGEY